MRIYKCSMRIYKCSMGFRIPAVDQSHWSIKYNYDLKSVHEPVPTKSLTVRHIKLSDALKIRDRIFQFYPGLPHSVLCTSACMYMCVILSLCGSVYAYLCYITLNYILTHQLLAYYSSVCLLSC